MREKERDSDSLSSLRISEKQESNLHETTLQTQEADRYRCGPILDSLVYHSAAAAGYPFGSRRLLSSSSAC